MTASLADSGSTVSIDFRNASYSSSASLYSFCARIGPKRTDANTASGIPQHRRLNNVGEANSLRVRADPVILCNCQAYLSNLLGLATRTLCVVLTTPKSPKAVHQLPL